MATIETERPSTRTPRPLILGIGGSERPAGNTDIALERAGELVRSRGARFEAIQLRDFDISPCSPCGDCNSRTTLCAVRDDTPAIVARMKAADGIIYATPVHGFGLAHLMQIFIEHVGVGHLRFERPLANKVGGAIITSRRYSDSHVYHQIVDNILLNRMILVGSGFPALMRNSSDVPGMFDTESTDALERMVHRMVDMVELLRERTAVRGEPVLPTVDINERVVRQRGPERTLI